jgi:hypothetical protein
MLIGFSDRHYFHSSDEIGVEGVRCIVNRWHQEHNVHTKTVGSGHDRDEKTKKLLGELWPAKQELLLPNHAIKSFDRGLSNDHRLNGIKEPVWRRFTFRLHRRIYRLRRS